MRPSKWCHRNEVHWEKFLPKAVYFHPGTTSRIRRLLPCSRESLVLDSASYSDQLLCLGKIRIGGRDALCWRLSALGRSESLQDQSSPRNGEASDFLQNWHKSHARSQQLIPKPYLASAHTGQKQIPPHSHAACNC